MWYSGGQFKEVADRYRVISPCFLEFNTLIYAVRLA